MTYDPRDTDPLYPDDDYGEQLVVQNWPDDGKPGVPRAVLVWGFGMVLVFLVIVCAALLLRGGAA